MKLYKNVLIAAALTMFVSEGLLAQSQDSILRRQLELEREFNPTLHDANKLNSLPQVPKPEVKKANTEFSTWAGRAVPPLEISVPEPATVMTEIPFDTKKGYVGLSAGNYANVDGVFGYRAVDSEQNKLSVLFRHNSTNGDIRYVQDSDPATNKAYVMNNLGKLQYDYTGTVDFNVAASYFNSIFKYYGNTFENSSTFNNKNQSVGVFNLNALFGSQNNSGINYKAGFDFNNFTTKYALIDAGFSGNKVDAIVSLEKPFAEGSTRIGVDGLFTGTFYSLPQGGVDMDDFLSLRATPYAHFTGSGWDAKLGVNAIFKLNNGNKVYVTPNATVSLNITDMSSIYATAGGQLHDNTFLSVFNESRYVSPVLGVLPSISLVDVKAGVKIGEVSGFRFDVFGGFKKTEDEHFFAPSQSSPDSSMPPRTNFYTYEYLMPVYGNLSHTHIGGSVRSNIWAPLDILLSVKKNIYSVSNSTSDLMTLDHLDQIKAYNLPGVEAEMRATFDALTNLRFTFDYYFASDRWSYFNDRNVKMNDISDLNLGAVYSINSAISINVKVNNVLFQKYDIWYGHPAQSFNMMGGFVFKF